MGEKNEIKTFDAVSSSFDTILRLIRQITNFNGTNIFVTSDHGFLYTNKATSESEFCKVDVDEAIKLNRRFIITHESLDDNCISKFDTKSLGISSKYNFYITKSINKIRVQGGTNRFVHGGATLQELVVPLLRINKKRKSDVKTVDVEIVPLRAITTNSLYVTLYQLESVSQKINKRTLKIYFESSDGKVLSDEVIYTFDIEDEYETNRQKKFKLTFKKDVQKYNNSYIKLVLRSVLENSSEMPLYKEMKVKLSLSFFDDF